MLYLSVHLFAMSHPEDQHSNPLVLDITNQTIVADSVSPESFLGTLQWFAQLTWIR